MKIAVIGTRGFPNVQGGIETHCENLYPELAKFDINITVFTRHCYVDPSIKNYKGVTLKPLWCLKNKFLETITHTFCGVIAAKFLKADIIHFHAVGPALFVPLARLLRMKVVLTHHGPDYKRAKWGQMAKLILRLGEYLGVKYSNQIITISDVFHEEIKKKYNKEAIVIPNGVNIPTILESTETLKKYNIEKQKYIFTLGRFVPEKGFHDLIKAYTQLQQNEYKLVIAGDADHETEYSKSLKTMAKKNNNIILTGFLKGIQLQELFSHARLFILPSFYEGLPIALLEALSYGLSCIVSDIPQNKEIQLDENRFFTPGNTVNLGTKIKTYLAATMNKEQQNHQRNMIHKKYDWKQIAEHTLNVYKLVI